MSKEQITEVQIVRANVTYVGNKCSMNCDHIAICTSFCTLYKEHCNASDGGAQVRCTSCRNGTTEPTEVSELLKQLEIAERYTNDKRVSLAQEIAGVLRNRGHKTTCDYISSDLINDVANALLLENSNGYRDGSLHVIGKATR